MSSSVASCDAGATRDSLSPAANTVWLVILKTPVLEVENVTLPMLTPFLCTSTTGVPVEATLAYALWLPAPAAKVTASTIENCQMVSLMAGLPCVKEGKITSSIALSIWLPFMSRSAVMELGVEPSSDRVLANAVVIAAKFAFIAATELKLVVSVVSAAIFAISL